jgi:putative tryptophan/tyrosine transport system substrate-binding protein
MKRREFFTLLGGAAAAWPIAARAQQPGMPLIGFVSGRSPEDAARPSVPFRKGLAEAGFVEGQNVSVDYHWLGGQYDRVQEVMANLIRRRVAVIVTQGGNPAALAAKAATTTVPIVFALAVDPVQVGLVASLARPGGNVTGINYLNTELIAKRLGLLRDVVPKATRIAVLVNPANPTITEATQRDIAEAAHSFGLQARVLRASTSREIEAAFATLTNEPADALFVANDAFFSSRRVQFAIQATRYAMPVAYSNRDFVEAGGLMSYGTDLADAWHQLGIYAGRILKGAKPADLPVIQSSKFELVINLAAARTLGLTVPGDVLSIADEVIE